MFINLKLNCCAKLLESLETSGDMNGKVCIVTGASSGIGRAAATLFAKNNARVVAVGRNIKELKTLQTEVQTAGGK